MTENMTDEEKAEAFKEGTLYPFEYLGKGLNKSYWRKNAEDRR